MTSSGTYTYDPQLQDIGIDAFGRLQIRSSDITTDHLVSLKRSMNSVLVRWANRDVNLWAVVLEDTALVEGVSEYVVPSNTVVMLDTYVRLYQLDTPEDMVPDLDTTISSTTVTINWTDHGLAVDNYINVIIPVAIGGIIVYGFYQVVSVPDDNSITITAADTATATVSGGSVPVFDTTTGDATVTVTLANHGYTTGSTFTVQVQTDVGGIQLLGDYTLTSAATNTFTFENNYAAGSTDTVSENGGEAQLAGQVVNSQPPDRVLSPLSRTDYASIPNKFTQGPPTSYWFDRTISPTVKIWPVPDANGPYQLRYYRMRRIQDASPVGTETTDIPYRFYEAFVAGVSAQLAITWKPEVAPALLQYADQVWEEAASADRERVTLNLSPTLDGYFQ